MNIKVLDNVVPKELLHSYNNVDVAMKRDRSDDRETNYYTFVEYGSDLKPDNETVIDAFVHFEAKEIWEWFTKKTGTDISKLISCYINGMSFGDEGYAHVDSDVSDNSVTCIIYLNPAWHSQWGGETVFYSGEYVEYFSDDWYYEHEIVKSVLPRYGRIILFEGHIPHSVRPLSKKCLIQRRTFMFKLINVDINDIKKGLLDATT